MPTVNSYTKSKTTAAKVRLSMLGKPIAWKYSPNLYSEPQGSIALTNPDTTNVTPTKSRATHVATEIRVGGSDLSLVIPNLDKSENCIIDDIPIIGIDTLGDDGLAMIRFDLFGAHQLLKDNVGETAHTPRHSHGSY